MSNLKTLNARSETLLRASAQVDKAIAHHLVEIAKHVNGKGNGDTSAVNYFWSLLTAGRKSGLRHDAIGNWLLAYAGVTWNAEKKRYNRKKDFDFDVKAATENPWYLFTKQAEFKPFDLEKALKALITKATNALNDDDPEHKHSVNKDLLRRIEALADPKALPKTADVKAEEAAPEGWTVVEGGADATGGEVTAEAEEAPIAQVA